MTRLLKKQCAVFLFGCLLALGSFAPQALAVDGQGTLNVPRPVTPQECLVNGRNECKRLDRNTADVLLQADLFLGQGLTRNICRFIDNLNNRDFFIPLRDSDFDSFENSKNRLNLVIDECCPATPITLAASDGQTYTHNLALQRSMGVGAPRTENPSHTFTLSRQDCTTHGDGTTTCNTVTWQETVSTTYTCSSGAWGLTGPTITTYQHTGSCSSGTWIGSVPVPAVGAPPVCAPTYVPANCPPSFVHNQTWNEQTGTPAPVCSPHVCTYPSGASLSGDYNCQGRRTMTPRVCNDGNILATGPSYDENDGASYLTCPPDPGCPAPLVSVNGACVSANIDTLAFASTCEALENVACISNGVNCLTGTTGRNVQQSFIPGTHDGTFCSSISVADSAGDGARATFDLSGLLAGKTGRANIIVPYGVWFGIRDAVTARTVMANPANYPNLARFSSGGSLSEMTAITLYIPDIEADFSQSQPNTQYDDGCGKDCRNNFSYSINYYGATKQLVIESRKGARWKKHRTGPWNTATAHGRGNGKVWSEVRVVHPPIICPVEFEYETGPEVWTCSDTCSGTTFENTKIRYRNRNEGGCNVPGAWVDITPVNYCPASGTCDGSDDGGNGWWRDPGFGGGGGGGGGGGEFMVLN